MNFFKQDEQKPFAYPSIEMRKSSRGYFKWVAVIIILIFVLFIVFSFLTLL
jgi:uncharacterized membrane protein YukC